MIQFENTLLSEDLFEKHFTCDLNACKGACCVEGDAGAPLEKEEIEQLKKLYSKIKPYLRKEGIKAIKQQGVYTIDDEGDYVTPLIDNKECAYVVFDEKGIAKCGIEQAHSDGKISFKKPISCHLYPIRINKVGKMDALNYSKWGICDPACALGASTKIKIYEFVKDALIRKYGDKWYEELKSIDEQLLMIAKNQK